MVLHALSADVTTKRIRDAFAATLRELRTSAGLSQERLAADAGYDRTYIGQIERSEKSVTIITLFDLARVLQVTPAAMIERTQKLVTDGNAPSGKRTTVRP